MTTDPTTGRQCTHQTEDNPVRDIRDCWQCMTEILTELMIAKTYLTEIAMGEFDEHGRLTAAVSETALVNRGYQAIAATALKVMG